MKKKTPSKSTKNPAELELKLETAVYPLEAIQAAVYTFTGRAFARLSQDGPGRVAVRLKAKAGETLEGLADELHNELLHEALRLKVSQANQKLREYIVTRALVSAQEDKNSPPAAAAPRQAPPPPAAEPAPLVDAALEKEIDALLLEIEKSGPAAADPLGVAVPWKEKKAP